MAEEKKFGILDYVIFVLTLVISAGIGFFMHGETKGDKVQKIFFLGADKCPYSR